MIKQTIPTILKKICARKLEEVEERKALTAIGELKFAAEKSETPRGFASRMLYRMNKRQPAVIAEVKKASPSKGVIRDGFDPAEIAIQYEAGGAVCLSVLTDRDFFMGDDSHLVRARRACSLPVLRKDFVLDPYQIWESRVLGADAILLIVACLSDVKLKSLYTEALAVGLDVLVEVHNVEELHRALKLDLPLIGINNRNLHSFDTSLQVTLDLLDAVPDTLPIVTESGIHTRDDVKMMRAHDVQGFLVGEAFMKSRDPGLALKDLFA